MARILLFDNQRDLSFLYMHFDQVIHSPLSKHKPMAWLKGAWKALCSSHKGDTIVCWYDFQAIILFYLCRLTCSRRKIVCINILLKHKDTWKNRVVSQMYKQALNHRDFSATVTSTLYGQQVRQWLGLDCQFTLLRDLFFEDYRLPDHDNITVKQDTVFCGGSNGRDWELMLEVARCMPHLKFRLVMTMQILSSLHEDIPQNVSIVHDIPLITFVHEMSEAAVVCNPLDTDAPAGLIVIFRAAANDRPVIVTDTIVTREYIQSGDSGLLVPNDVQAWCKAISYMLHNTAEADRMACSLHQFLSQNCNDKVFADTVLSLTGSATH